MANQELRDLYIDELKDLYSAENQLVKALPKLAKASTSDELRAGFEQQRTGLWRRGWDSNPRYGC